MLWKSIYLIVTNYKVYKKINELTNSNTMDDS